MIQTRQLAVAQHPTGVELTIPVITVDAGVPGPSVYIQANLHGAEVQGNAVIHHLLEALSLHPPAGRITLVPLANPLGINHKNGEFTLGRFDPVTGNNWNRQYHFCGDDIADFVATEIDSDEDRIKAAFRDKLKAQLRHRLEDPWGLPVGQHLALRLQQLSLDADIVLDLHTGPVSGRHLYVPKYARERARAFNIPLNILMGSEFGGALDEATFSPWWQLSEAFAALGRQVPVWVDGFTLELGSQEQLDLTAAKRDALGILNYLQHSHQSAPWGPLWSLPQWQIEPVPLHACELVDYRAYYSPRGGQVEYLAKPEQPLAAGAPLARLWHFDRLGASESEQHDHPLSETLSLPCDAIPVLHFASASVQQGTELYKVLTNTFPL
ncbi:succinylglutamate desuccinylase/aspartoacylase domain-containing protein [Ferrimonas gelatinilytica]|uniref:M14 family metallopeptidase n=1 Tax=Ferrimonas gelatinilytica TaxID=1255257 RepID=A0ABP9RYC2_9GAMM